MEKEMYALGEVKKLGRAQVSAHAEVDERTDIDELAATLMATAGHAGKTACAVKTA